MFRLSAPHTLFLDRLLGRRSFDLAKLRCFEMIFFGGLALHLTPYVLSYHRFLVSPGEDLLDVDGLLPACLPAWVLLGCAYLGLLLGIIGAWVRVAALMSTLALQTLLHRNSVPVLTLAISHAQSILMLFILGSGSSRRGRSMRCLGSSKLDNWPSANWTRTLILYSTLLGVFLSAVEKLYSGWLIARPVHSLLGLPQHHLIRPWALQLLAPARNWVAPMIEYGTLLFELVLPILLALVPAPRKLVWLWLAFFGGVFLMLKVPPLFVTSYGVAVLLALEYRTPENA